MANGRPHHVAVIGAGMAGATCAHALTLAGHAVHVFDKSRGPGGRLAARRVAWVDRHGQARTARLDHGAIGITARCAAFRSFIDQAQHAGWVTEWVPRLSTDSSPLDDGGGFHLPVPHMPSLCRHLLRAADATWSFAVDRLHRGPLGWQVHAGSDHHPMHFDAVVLALPPAQAAPLLGPHRADWVRHAAVVCMQPCWTLMGIAKDLEAMPQWDLARPPSGPLAWVLRNDARPGRQRVPGHAQWVVHARAGWSRRHLEQPAAWIMQEMQAALCEWLGRPVEWHCCMVHRWRYALPQAHRAAPVEPFWWDAAQGLGVCGDFLGGGGVEGAWLSARALCTALPRCAPAPAEAPFAFATDEAGRLGARRFAA